MINSEVNEHWTDIKYSVKLNQFQVALNTIQFKYEPYKSYIRVHNLWICIFINNISLMNMFIRINIWFLNRLSFDG